MLVILSSCTTCPLYLLSRATATVRRSPAKRTNFVSTETPSYPWNELKFTLQACFHSQPGAYTTDYLKSQVGFLRNTPSPKRVLFVSFGFCELLRWSLTSQKTTVHSGHLFSLIQWLIFRTWKALYRLKSSTADRHHAHCATSKRILITIGWFYLFWRGRRSACICCFHRMLPSQRFMASHGKGHREEETSRFKILLFLHDCLLSFRNLACSHLLAPAHPLNLYMSVAC